MKKMVTFLLTAMMIFSSISVFANEPNLNLKSLESKTKELNVKYEIVKEAPKGAKVYYDLTEVELENLIEKAQNTKLPPLHLSEEFEISLDDSKSEKTETSLIDSKAMSLSSGWTVVNKTKTLSNTTNYFGNSGFRVRRAIGVSYQFEQYSAPYSPDTRNWKFTDSTNGSFIHLNPGEFQIDWVDTNGSNTSTSVTYTYEGVVNQGFYAVISGIVIRFPGSDRDFDGDIRYYLSDVQ